jgi:hypothetical protein
MHESKRCHRDGCAQLAITTFRGEMFCLEHFCCRCYQFLERIGQCTVNGANSSVTIEQALLADECARRTIDICLNADGLNNLERARLLDILLWCGDISAAFVPKSQAEPALVGRLPYHKPEVRRVSARAAD